MKQGFIHVTFVIDKSGSMYPKREDVIGGFNSFIEQQKKEKVGETTVSIYFFDGVVEKMVVNKNVDDVELMTDESYMPVGSTALNDALGTAIDETGEYLASLNEEDRPSKVMLVVMTDGYENASKKFTLNEVREKIKHQEDKYSWNFIYIGADLTDDKQAQSYGLRNSAYGDGSQIRSFASALNNYATSVRNAVTMDCLMSADMELTKELSVETTKYERKLGKKIKED